MERCPCCNARLRDRTVCSRCKSDLSLLISSEQVAQDWLATAIAHWKAENIEQSIDAIGLSLNLKITRMAEVFREFIIQQECQKILDLLAEKELLAAKQSLYRVRKLLPFSQQLQQLYSFSEYLLVNNTEAIKPKSLVVAEEQQGEVVTTSWLKRLRKAVKPFESAVAEYVAVVQQRTESAK